MSDEIKRHSKKLTESELTAYMEEMLFGANPLSCLECSTSIDPDQEYCIECGLNNPLMELGLI